MEIKKKKNYKQNTNVKKPIMDRENKKSNYQLKRHNDRRNNSKSRTFRTNQSEFVENNAFDFKSLKQHTEQLNLSNSNPQDQWRQNPNKNSYYSTDNNANSSNHNPREQWRTRSIDKQEQYNDKHDSFKKNSNNNTNNKKYDSQKEIKQFVFGFKRLEELCNKEPSEIIFVMSNRSNGFMDLFKQNKEPDWIFLLMKVSAKICDAEFQQSKLTLLTELTCNTFFDHLNKYIITTPTEKKHRVEKLSAFFDDCFVVFQSITTLFPKTAVERLKGIVLSCNIALNGIKTYCDNIKINENTINDMHELLQKLNDIKITDELKLKEKSVHDNIAQNFPPPQNFRDLTVFPTTVDLEVQKPFLRPNILKGAYQNIEHYLDVQFRLLREDFIGPLREGINFYKEMINNKQKNQPRKKINNIRIYHDVEFETKGQFVHDKSGYVINFNKKNKLKVNWEMAKRFMYGSLLLFTVNEFNTFFLGVVLERKIELLKQGKLIVELLNNAKPKYATSLLMVESEVFFEPYKCSMEVLKTINSDNFPMERYIISACKEIDYPYYIDKISNQQYSIDDMRHFHILVDGEWPTKEQLQLDEMQYKAFKAALTNEFTIIQGPPGTGKTFIGLKIMKTLINNLYADVSYNEQSGYKTNYSILTKPILVVCYTNHALDQFTEGILNFTHKIVRIGGQSKSEILENYSLKKITQMYRRSATTNVALRNIGDKVKNCMAEIKYLKQCSEVVSYNAGILELSLLKNGMPKKYHNFFKTTLDLLSWLFQDRNYFNVDPIRFIKSISYELIDKIFYSEKLLEIKQVLDENDDVQGYVGDDPDLEYCHKDIVIYSITLNDIKCACKELLSETIRLDKESEFNINCFDDYETAKLNFENMEKIHDYFVDMLSLVNVDIDLPRSINLSMLNMRQRWALYFNWVKETNDMFEPKILDYEQKYINVYKQYAELRQLENIEIFNKMHIIALTTTGAAKHRIMLEGLESPIVVVEEAAEVLEAHIISSLTKYCQHLILIGDHKQLRPSNAVYKLAKDYNFDISLFERMVNNDVPCYTLGEQHRMRPEISKLISPIIYPNLKNHSSVFNRENVRGVTKDLFFLNHNEYENEVEEISSKSNEHEAKFLIMFARHLLLQGYRPEQVTILTTYSGQLFLLRSLRKKHSILQDMKITVVDNYQGEESDIILLSLVRSNENKKVGFLKTQNRICVALSRAKYGLYIMGNMDNLYSSGDLWKQIKESLVSQDSYGDVLTLECAVHSEITTKVSKSEDFNLIMEGGCKMLCTTLLRCGHYCTSICHSYDREHLKIKCREPCNRSCDYNHPCMKKCFEDCGQCNVKMLKNLPCGHQSILQCFVDTNTFPCDKMVETELEKCGHKIIHKCHEKIPDCTFKCFDRLDCGHACERNCHKNDDPDHENYKCLKPCENTNEKCTLNHKCLKFCYEDCSTCTVKIDKTLACGHTKTKVPCGLNDKDIKCFRMCDRILMCNHKCTSLCHEICQPCQIKVDKIIPDCGHRITIECYLNPTRKDCTQNCERTIACGHKCKKLCSEKCTTDKCDELVLQKTSILACGHNKAWVLCCDRYKEFKMDSEYLLDKCSEPCSKKLNCNDICHGTCGKCKQGRLHIPCSEICNKINPCNHVCKYPCKERCPPCNDKCLYSCIHSKCRNICGKPCVPCKERCNWKCRHLCCTKKCGEICNRIPCYKPCDSILECKHNCIGFCGEPCPPLCRICQKDEVTTIIFGNEDEPDARFVYLEDCGHSIESEALEQWMNQNDKEIVLKQCPLCKTPILKTQRFLNRVKNILKDIAEIKKKQYAEQFLISSNKTEILQSLKSLSDEFESTFIGDLRQFRHIKDLWDIFCRPLIKQFQISQKNSHEKKTHKKNRNPTVHIPTKEIESLDFVINLFTSTSKYKQIINEDIDDGPMKQTIINHFVWLLSVTFTYAKELSNQQKFDINMEMARGARIVSLYKILSSEQYKVKVQMNTFTTNTNEVKNLIGKMTAILMSCETYNLNRDKEIENFMKLIEQKIDGIAFISDEEKKMIHKAMAVNFHGGERSQGHWCKCPNGHIYCITECGGPMQESVCPECKVKIGGQNHHYVSGVTVASEMDGARGLAWSPANNVGNYVFDE